MTKVRHSYASFQMTSVLSTTLSNRTLLPSCKSSLSLVSKGTSSSIPYLFFFVAFGITLEGSSSFKARA